MNCPNCGTPNDSNNRFCLKCGTALVATAPAPQPPPVYTPPASPPPTAQPPAWTLPPQQQPVYQQQQPPPAAYQPQGGYPVNQPYYGTPGISGLNIWGPFAGYGSRRRHVGWLMNGQGERASDLVTKVEAKFREREIPGVRLSKEALVARGVAVETRPYFILRRGLASLALYITQFGRDLFISQVAYLKPPVSNFRVVVALAMLVFQGFMTVIYPLLLRGLFNSLAQSFNFFGQPPSDTLLGMLFVLLCIIGPIGSLNALALLILFCFSLYKFISVKDFFAALRVPPNEFNEDDLMAMEKAVEETVRQSLTDLKLNPDDLKMATMGQGGQLF